MSTASESARAAAKSKVERLTRSDPHARVDASNYAPEGDMDAGVQTGPRPISRRQFRRGGKVAGEASPARADRKPRAAGGALTANSLINRNVKSANEERHGIKHIGGMKTGGRAAHAKGGEVHADEAQDKKLLHKMGCKCAKCDGGRVGRKSGGAAKGGPAINDGTRPVAGRLARKGGGRTKKGTTVNVVIAPQGGQAGPPPMGPPPGGPVGLHQGAPPPAAMGPGVPPTMPPGAPPPMRKAGGRIGDGFGGKLAKPGAYPIDAGAGGGLGRLEKAKAARP